MPFAFRRSNQYQKDPDDSIKAPKSLVSGEGGEGTTTADGAGVKGHPKW